MSKPASAEVAITYVPADCGSVIPGKSKAPDAFRKIDIVNKLKNAGVPSVQEQDALDEPATYSISSFDSGSVRNETLNIEVCKRVHETVASALEKPGQEQSPFQLILGGECCMLPAVMSAVWHHAESLTPARRVGLIYIDADTDLASPTDPNNIGNLAGMNMTHLTRTPGALESMKPFTRASGEGVCDSSNTILFGINMTNPGNKREHFAHLFDNNYKVVTSASVARDPQQRAVDALRYLEERVDVIMVHLDVDAIDPTMFPLANLPNFTGVTFEQMMKALGIFMGSKKVGGLTIAEVNPDHDPGLKMVEHLTDEIVRMLGDRAGQ